jgi:hypothetical protein
VGVKLLKSMLAVCLWVSAQGAFATAQESDVIIVDGRARPLNTNPLQGYLATNPGGLPQSERRMTSNWRGYVATWEVRDNALLLTKVDVHLKDESAPPNRGGTSARNVLTSLFPDATEVPAVWYSGALVIPTGELIDYVHMGYGSTYASYLILIVQSGLVTRRLEMDMREFEAYRVERFEAFKATAEYRAKLKKMISEDPEWAPENGEGFLFQFESENYLSRDPESN